MEVNQPNQWTGLIRCWQPALPVYYHWLRRGLFVSGDAVQVTFLPLSGKWLAEHNGIQAVEYNQDEAVWQLIQALPQMSAAPHPVAGNGSGDERGAGDLAGGHLGMT